MPSNAPTMYASLYPSLITIRTTASDIYRESFNFSQILDILFNSTMKKYNSTNLNNNIILQNDIIIYLLEQASNWIAGVQNDEIEIKITSIWGYDGTIGDKCQLKKAGSNGDVELQLDPQRTDLFYLSWIRFNISFVTLDKRNEWKSDVDDVIEAFSNQLTVSHYFINDTISILYCPLEKTQENNAIRHVNTITLEYFAIIFTICIVNFFIFIAICGCIDATFIRRNEIFSIGAIMSVATYTIDIFSGDYCFFSFVHRKGTTLNILLNCTARCVVCLSCLNIPFAIQIFFLWFKYI